MHGCKARTVLSPLVVLIVLAIAALAVEVTGSSEAQSGSLYGCPGAGRWSIAVWDGQSGTSAADALGTCGSGAVEAAYSLDPQTQSWLRWFSGRPEISNLATLNDLQGVIALGSPPASPAATPVAPAGPDSVQNCPLAGKWAISVWSGQDGIGVDQALASCGPGAVGAAYYLDPQTGAWLRWFSGRPDINSLTSLDNLQGIIALGSTWEHYLDEEFGYQFDYPPEFSLERVQAGELSFPTIDAVFLTVSPSEFEAPFIAIEVQENPEDLAPQDYYDGEPGPDFFGQSSNEYEPLEIDERTALLFNPYVTFGGQAVVIVTLGDRFLLVVDEGAAYQESGVFRGVLDSIRIR